MASKTVSWQGKGEGTPSLGQTHSVPIGYEKEPDLVVMKYQLEHSCYEKDRRPPISSSDHINFAHTFLLIL